MAGLTGEQVVVDVVAASEQLVPSTQPATEPGERLEAAVAAPSPVGPSCALGHPNTEGARFCASCGLSMDATPFTAAEPVRPKPEAELTEEEKAERDRQHQAALAEAARFEAEQAQYEPDTGKGILIHFIEDGLTAFGQVWYRGQELQISPDHPRWAEALGWITLNRAQQFERYGRQFFDFGPWPGRRSYADAAGSFEQLVVTDHQGNKLTYGGPSEAELRAADEAELRRGRAVPAATAFR